jgi:hypothetical protein
MKENRFVYYRLAVDLEERASLEVSISANSRYRLWMNGEPIGSGPLKGDRWRHYYETMDVSASLCKGRNVFAVQVWSLNTYMVNDPINPDQPLYAIASLPVGPRLAVRGICLNRSGESLADITTGIADWRVWVDDAVSFHSDDQYTIFLGAIAERVQAACLPTGWKQVDYKADEWLPAVIDTPCYGLTDQYPYYIVPQLPIVERPIPLLYEQEREFKREMPRREADLQPFSFIGRTHPEGWVEIPPHSRAYVELDAGELTTAYLTYPIALGQGAKIVYRYAERYFVPGHESADTVRDDSVRGVIMGMEDVYYPSGNYEQFEPFWFRTFRFIRIEVYTEDQPLWLMQPSFRETAYPLTPRSTVESTVPWVEPLWRISLRTLQLCMHETYEDCPYYEQMQFIMDTRLQALFTYSVGGDIGLARKALEDFHSSLLPEGITQNRFPSGMVQIIPSFSLHFIFMLHDYYWQTGDLEIVRRYRPTVDAILDWFERKIGSTGLVENIGYWEYIDWVKEWDFGVPTACKHGPSTIHNLVYAYGLQLGAKLYAATGRNQVSEEYEARAKRILSTVHSLCWSEERGMYREGPTLEQYSQHAQLWAVLTELCEGERAKLVLTHALDESDVLPCSFSMAFFMFRAIERVGIYELTSKLMGLWIKSLELGLTTLPETPSEPRSDCHAWSALPLYEFMHVILGIKSTKPGWSEIIIEPQTLELPDMSGELYTPVGVVSVTWRHSESSFEISGQVPEGIPFRVRFADRIDHFFENGGPFYISYDYTQGGESR